MPEQLLFFTTHIDYRPHACIILHKACRSQPILPDAPFHWCCARLFLNKSIQIYRRFRDRDIEIGSSTDKMPFMRG